MSSRDEKRESTKRRVYESALAVFRKDGVAGCRIDDIAKLAGVSRAAFYFHFPTKEDVLQARMRETEIEIGRALEALPEGASLDRVLAEVCGELARIWEPDPTLLPDVASTGLRLAATSLSDQSVTPLRGAIAEHFERAEARGELQSDLPAAILGDLYLGNLLAGLLTWYGNQSIPLRGILDGVTTLFWNGVRRR